MKWPFVLRSVHEAEMRTVSTERDAAQQQASYWRARAELFIDRASARVGISHEPVMRHAGDVPLAHPLDGNPFAGLGLNVMDSTKADGRIS